MNAIHCLARTVRNVSIRKFVTTTKVSLETLMIPLSKSPIVMSHLFASGYLRSFVDQPMHGRMGQIDFMGAILMKNVILEWGKYLNETKHLHSISDVVEVVSMDHFSSISRTADRLATNHKKPVAFRCRILGGHHTKEMIIIGKKTTYKPDGLVMKMEEISFLKHILNYPSRLRITNVEPSRNIMQCRKVSYHTNEEDIDIMETMMFSDRESEQYGKNRHVVTYIDLGQLFCSVLSDSFLKRRDNNVLLIYPSLIPLKTIVLCEAQDSFRGNEILQLANELCQMISSWGITCWNGSDRGLNVMDADEMGCMFTILVDESVIRDGLLRIRSVYTTLEMKVHITRLHEVLRKHLTSSYAIDHFST